MRTKKVKFLKPTLAVVTLLVLAACSGNGMSIVPAGVSAGGPVMASAHRTRMDAVGGGVDSPPLDGAAAFASSSLATITTTTLSTPAPTTSLYCKLHRC